MSGAPHDDFTPLPPDRVARVEAFAAEMVVRLQAALAEDAPQGEDAVYGALIGAVRCMGRFDLGDAAIARLCGAFAEDARARLALKEASAAGRVLN